MLCEALDQHLRAALANSSCPSELRIQQLLTMVQQPSDVHPDVLTLLPTDDVEFTAQFFQQLDTLWQKLHSDNLPISWELVHTLEEIAKQQGNVDRQITLRESIAEDNFDYLQLCQLCIEHQRLETASYWLDKLRHNKDKHRSSHQELSMPEIQLYCAQGNYDLAITQQWQNFCTQPQVQHYLTLSQLLEQAGHEPNSFFAKAEQRLIEQMKDNQQHCLFEARIPSNTQLLSFYIATEHWQLAVELAEDQLTDTGQLHKLARKLQDCAPEKSLAFYSRVIEKAARQTTSHHYDHVASLFKELLAIDPVRPAALALLNKVRQQQARKPLLIKRLNNIESSGQ